ncbi:MAG: AAA family ATPase, partial [Verrucomicrobia bacterium]
MKFFADMHIHSRYSRATSRDCNLVDLARAAARKGILVLGTGDFTHPAWFRELQEGLEPASPGLFRLKKHLAAADGREEGRSVRDVLFVLQVEISTIYKKDGRTRKVHHVIYAPSFEAASQLRNRLDRIGNIESDG